MDFKKYLSEATKVKHAFVVSGRYNPPTIGHMHLFKQAHDAATAAGGDLHIVASHSEGTSKNPLPQDKKMEYLRKVLPKGTTVSGTSSQAPSIFHSLADLYKKGYTHVTMVSDAPRTAQYREQIPKYNNVEGRHGHYNFKKINFISAGERNPDDESGIEGVSATKAREHALAGRMEEFKSMLPKELHPHAEEMANHIKLANEDYENPYRFDDATPEGTDYMRKLTPGERSEPKMKKNQLYKFKEKTNEQQVPILFKDYSLLEQEEDLIEKEVWDQAKDRANLPKEKLSSGSKAKAKARAKAAGRPYPNMVDNIWAARQQESKIVSFSSFIGESKEEKEELSDEEIEKMVEGLDWEDIVDLYDKNELVDEEDDDEEDDDEDKEEVNEALSAQARIKKRQSFARFKGRRGVARSLKLRRASGMDVLQRRAKVAARRALYKRFLKGRDKSQLSAAEKTRIEQQVGRLKLIQTTLAQRMLPKIRSIEQKRLSRYRSKK